MADVGGDVAYGVYMRGDAKNRCWDLFAAERALESLAENLKCSTLGGADAEWGESKGITHTRARCWTIRQVYRTIKSEQGLQRCHLLPERRLRRDRYEGIGYYHPEEIAKRGTYYHPEEAW